MAHMSVLLDLWLGVPSTPMTRLVLNVSEAEALDDRLFALIAPVGAACWRATQEANQTELLTPQTMVRDA